MHFVRMENGEPKGQPMLKDVMLADAQVTRLLSILLTGHNDIHIYNVAIIQSLIFSPILVQTLKYFVSVVLGSFYRSWA